MMLISLLRVKIIYNLILTIIKYRLRFKKIGKLSIIKKVKLLVNSCEATIGAGVVIEKDATLMCIKDYCSVGYSGCIIIGDNCYINHSFNVTCVRMVIIGNNVTIAYNVSIFDNVHGTDPSVGNYNRQPLIKRPQITIADGAWIGANCFIMSSIGKGCIIGANSVVTKPVPDYCIAVGNPARIIKRYDFEKREWIKV